jgi:prephenate dehydrogenase
MWNICTAKIDFFLEKSKNLTYFIKNKIILDYSKSKSLSLERFREVVFMKITIIGLGLIGGSIALSLQENGFADEIFGVDNSEAHQRTALEKGLVNEIVSLEEGIQKADLIIVATPVDVLAHLLPIILEQIDNQVVIEVGSTKMPIVKSIENHPKRSRFMATHPMAGTEYSGPEAAIRHLFTGKNVVLCDVEKSDADVIKSVEKLYKSLFMKLIYMNSEEHDVHTAYISHISHICSFALALTVLEKEKKEYRIFELASSGFDSTVRLAKSNPETWIPIFQQNQENLLDVLDEYINNLLKFKGLMLSESYEKLKSELEKANGIKKILK